MDARRQEGLFTSRRRDAEDAEDAGIRILGGIITKCFCPPDFINIMMDEVDHVMSLNVAVSKDFSLRADFTPKICTEINKNIFLRYSAGAARPTPSDKHD